MSHCILLDVEEGMAILLLQGLCCRLSKGCTTTFCGVEGLRSAGADPEVGAESLQIVPAGLRVPSDSTRELFWRPSQLMGQPAPMARRQLAALTLPGGCRDRVGRSECALVQHCSPLPTTPIRNV